MQIDYSYLSIFYKFIRGSYFVKICYAYCQNIHRMVEMNV